MQPKPGTAKLTSGKKPKASGNMRGNGQAVRFTDFRQRYEHADFVTVAAIATESKAICAMLLRFRAASML